MEHGFGPHLADYSNPADFLMDIVEGILSPVCDGGGGGDGRASAAELADAAAAAVPYYCQEPYNYLETPYRWWRAHVAANDGGLAKLTARDVAENRDVFACTARTVPLDMSDASGAVPVDAQVLCEDLDGDGDKDDFGLGTSFSQQFRLFFFRSVYLLEMGSGLSDALLVAFIAALVAVARAGYQQLFVYIYMCVCPCARVQLQ